MEGRQLAFEDILKQRDDARGLLLFSEALATIPEYEEEMGRRLTKEEMEEFIYYYIQEKVKEG